MCSKRALLLLTLLAGCGDKSEEQTPTRDSADTDTDTDTDSDTGTDTNIPADADGDGFNASKDCDDTNPAIYPGADEICDGVDNDCDGEIDDDDSSVDASTGQTFYSDSDGDGYGDSDDETAACAQPSGTVADDADCNDSDPLINPSATEDCQSGIDEDCDGLVDCEDGTCASACTESECDDGLDDDGDGNIDCRDYDCLGMDMCISAMQIALGGGFVRQSYYDGSMSASSWDRLSFGSVYGDVRTYRVSAGTWRTCSWEWGNVTRTWTGGSGLKQMALKSGDRYSLTIGGSCELTGDSFLPYNFANSSIRGHLPWKFDAQSLHGSGWNEDWYQASFGSWTEADTGSNLFYRSAWLPSASFSGFAYSYLPHPWE